MRGKSEETASNADHQTEQSNTNQQPPISFERVLDEPPPAYNESIPSSFDPKKPKHRIPVQNATVPNQVTVSALPRWGRHPVQVVCPNCNTNVQTRVETSSTIITVLLALFLALFCLCLAVIPFFSRTCKKTSHYCPNCNHVIGEVPEFK